MGVNEREPGGYDPVKISSEVARHVIVNRGDVELRRYYRFRGGRWYGGIATGDVIGCNLKCKFCWSWRFRDRYDVGNYYTPHEVCEKLTTIARSRDYRYVRLSGAEPTISRNHLLKLIKLVEDEGLLFILETNGILIGYDKSYANELSRFSNLIVRVSFKGTTTEEFHMLTGAKAEAFYLQLRALENLVEVGFKPSEEVYAAAMVGFSSDDNIVQFVKMLGKIHPKLVDVDWEYVILYPHVIKLLERYGLKPLRAVKPNEVPRDMI